MPFSSITSKKEVEAQYNAIVKLQEKCESCNFFRGRVAKSIFTYSVFDYEIKYITDDGPAMIAIAEYSNNQYAIYAPEYLTEKQLDVFSYLLREAEGDEKFIVFSKESYNAIKKYSRFGKPVNVKLYV